MNKKTIKIILLKESLIESILADIITFGFIVVVFFINYKFINSNNFVDVLLLFMFFVFVTSKGKAKKFYSNEDAVKYIKELKY